MTPLPKEIKTPYVSIVMIIGNQRDFSEKALASVLSQQGLELAEVLVFDTEFHRFRPLAGSDHPVVRVYPIQVRLPLHSVRAMAVDKARGEVVAFVEHHVLVIPGWLEAVVRGFRAGHAGVGGQPGVLNPGMGISDAITLINHGFFPKNSYAHSFHNLPGHNSAYRRDLLLSFGELLPVLLASELLLNFKIIEKGSTLWLDPAAKFLHLNEETLGTGALGYYYWNRSYGENLVRLFHWPWWRRILQGLATPAVPFVRYAKYMVHFWRHDRQSVPLLLRFTGAFLYTQGAAALGLALGALFGAGDAPMKFRDYELNYGRTL